jgi:hypothetical protein
MQLLAGLEVHVRLSGLEIMPPPRLLLHDVRRGAEVLDRSSPYPMQDTSDNHLQLHMDSHVANNG